MITLTSRQVEIINKLMSSSSYTRIKELSSMLDVSDRTIRYDLDYIEAFLSELDIQLIRKPKQGILLEVDTKQKLELKKHLFNPNSYIATKSEFTYLLSIHLLLNQSSTLESLANSLHASKNKVYLFLKAAEEELQEYGVTLDKKPSKGIFVQGNELDVRNAFASIVYKASQSSAYSLNYFFDQFTEELREKVFTFTSEYETRSAVQFSDDSLRELKLAISYQHHRIKLDKKVAFPVVEKKDLLQEEEFKQVSKLYSTIFATTLSEDEVIYLLKQLKGAKITALPGKLNRFHKQEDAYQITCMFAAEVSQRLGINFKQDIEFINGLMVHLQVAMHRIENNQIIENPLTEQVKYKYRYLFEITRKAIIKVEEKYNIIFPEEEIAYITMHLGASYERHSFSGYMPAALVVCGAGIATSSLLTTRLQLMVPELKIFGTVSAKDVAKYKDENIDFIISTVPLSLEDREVIVVNPLLEPEELLTLKSMIFRKTYQKQMEQFMRKELPSENIQPLSNFIKASHVQIHGSAKDWRAAIKQASIPLIQERYISNAYVHAMIHAVEDLGPYMVFMPEIAFVHAAGKKDTVFREGASLLTLDQAIPFGDIHQVMVRVIIVICSTESDSDLFIKLVQILEKPGNLEKIKHPLTIDDITFLN